MTVDFSKTIILRYLISAVLLLNVFVSHGKEAYGLETDSCRAVETRIKADFPYTVDDFFKIARKDIPGYSKKALQKDIEEGIVETKTVEGSTRVFRKALRNKKLIEAARTPSWRGRGSGASAQRVSYVDSVLTYYKGNNPLGNAHRVKYRFTIDVPVTTNIAGDTLSVWMPLPLPSQRQSAIEILSAEPAEYILSADRSVHNTIYFRRPAGSVGDTLRFSYTASFDTRGSYKSPEEILSRLQPYDTTSATYLKYTSFDSPHIVRLDSLAAKIAAGETNPYLLSERVFDYIVTHYPWAGAREYSTIDCIPRYVIRERHGDCGQVALLYISLMRTLGVPARWESGWMLHPGEKNLHDWAEVYFEGVGWVPVDVSFGRYSDSVDPEIRNFYSHGIDAHRLAANRGVCGEFFPPKKYIRSETVDAQMGEVETSRGNLFYPAWEQHMELLSVEPVEIPARQACVLDEALVEDSAARHGLISIPVASIRSKASHTAEISTQAVMGTPVKVLERSGEWLLVMTPETYTGWVPDSSVALLSPARFDAWRTSPDRRIVTDLWQQRVFSTPAGSGPRDMVSDLVLGSIVEIDPLASLSDNPAGRVPVLLPDGRRGWTDASLLPLENWAEQSFDAAKILETAYSMEGTPYLWGGMSTKALDCSGLVKVSYYNNGLILRRDASQQAKTGRQLPLDDIGSFRSGDLLFFGNQATGKITHVGIYDRDGRFIHSSGRVKDNSLHPDDPDYLYSPIKAVRIDGMEGTDGIIPVSAHPWYFKK